MDEMICLQDFENYAYKVLPRNALDYYRSGAGSEETLKSNRSGFLRYRIRPRILQNVSVRDLTTTVLGTKVSMPIGISPAAMQKMAHSDGECASARAAQEMGTIFILSTISTSSIEEVAEAAPQAIKWFQLYIYKDRELTKSLVKRAEKAGFKALVLTVDAQIFGTRRADVRNKFSLPAHLSLANFVGQTESRVHSFDKGSGINSYIHNLLDSSIEWVDIKWLQSITSLPIILKGILTAEDAMKALDFNIAGIFVSNHGGRQIDTAPSSIEALPEIVKAVGNKAEIYLDGGVREGIDVFKAIALGAKMVFIGRPTLWGLSYGGKEGVQHLLNLLKAEFDQTLALTGCTSIRGITKDMVVHENYFSRL